MAKLTPEQLAKLPIHDDDLLVIIPRDPAAHNTRTRVLVGDRQVALLTSFGLDVSITEPARVRAEWYTGSGRETLAQQGQQDPRFNVFANLLANQALLAPWLESPPYMPPEPNDGRTLWERLDEDSDSDE